LTKRGRYNMKFAATLFSHAQVKHVHKFGHIRCRLHASKICRF